MSLRLIALASMAALALAGCGKRGPLEQPPPMWGAKAKADYEAEQAAKAKAKADKAKADKAEKSGPNGYGPLPVDPAQKNTTIRQAPVEGGPTDPYRGPGQPQ